VPQVGQRILETHRNPRPGAGLPHVGSDGAAVLP
jgi:hypothetical protein